MKKAIIIFSVLLLLWPMVVPLHAQTDMSQGGPATMSPEPLYPVPPPSTPGGDAMIFDLFIVRPLAIAAFLIGTGVSIVATPFALASGTTRPVYDRLLNEPYDFAFCRPLGAGY